jgi:hypothetical protein
MSFQATPAQRQQETVEIDLVLLRELQERDKHPKSKWIRNVRPVPVLSSANPSIPSTGSPMDSLDTLKIIFGKASYYVDSKGKLNGYCSLNLIMRLWLRIQNYFDCNKTEEAAAKKIINTLHFIEKIDNRITIIPYDMWYNTDEILEESSKGYSVPGNPTLSCTFEAKISPRTFISYKNIAKKIISKFPKDRYPELNAVAMRLIQKSTC